MKKTIYLLLTLMISVAGYSQHTFKVLACKGNNAMKNDGSWNHVKAGTKLYDSNVIKVEKSGYIGLIHKDGKTLELKSEGEFTIAELTSRLASKSSSFTSKYASFVADNMNGSESGYNHNVTGSVSRGPQMKFKVFAEEGFAIIKNKPTTIAWDAPLENKDVIVRVMNFHNQVVLEKQISGYNVELDLKNEKGLKSGENYIITLIDKGDENITSNPIQFKLLDDKKANEVEKELADIESILDKESFMDNLTLVSFFDKKGLSIYASESLRQSMIQMPEVEDFKMNYRNYLAKKEVSTPTTFKW